MLRKLLIPALVSAALASPSAQAAVEMIAIGTLPGTTDLSGLNYSLENGAPANLLGGLGSGLAWAGGNTFLALPDRGPNALAYNSLVDDTTSYIARFQTLTFSVTPNAGPGLAYSMTPTLTGTTLLSSATPLTYGNVAGSGVPALNATNNTNYFTGRSDGFDPAQNSLNSSNARLDPEGIRVSNDGRSVFISDEYGPYVYQFDRATGQRINSFTLPSNLAVSNLSSQGSLEISGNTIGRVANKGMEGLAITPDGKTLVGIMQAPLKQDTNNNVRIVTIDIATGTTKEYAYQLTTGSGVSEIVALNDHEFLVDERDGKGLGDNSTASVKQLFKINITGATDVTGMMGNLSAFAVSKSLFLDIKAFLVAAGINAKDIPAKLEGVSFGQDLADGRHTLIIANDNDFLSTVTDSNHPSGMTNPSKFYVFAFSDADLGGSTYVAQQIAAVPEPETYGLLLAGLGILGLASRRRRSKSQH